MNENLELTKTLEYIGFSEKEVLVYLALLMLGKGTVTQISRKAGINRPTGYHILASLEVKELVKVSGKEPKQEYMAESPEQIEKFLSKKIENDQSFIKEARKIIPELKSIHNIVDRPKVLFYEGREGLEKVYEDTLTSTEPIRAYASVGDMHTGLPGYFPNYYKRRAGKGIAIRAIIPNTEAGKERRTFDSEEMRETALVSKDSFYFSPEINIYDNKVMIASWKEKLGIIIESKEIADSMKKIYELAWAEAKRLGKELEKN
ncbi:MAG: Transcriptional regulator, TrmB [Candidatus Nomurabacteria bacterium GW2011_GWA1_37_20]|uniref:Transcriptional regulator, TrmB n=2 Tax=Parcubacteria group TaxID=1794811 RepID=A0A0G0KDU9_9BACT|nr:MAG: Transcriptional regulator, TrmB [Parcubacteria group bacterium GW2011_GWC1_36_9]KKQ28472.1 MAG: Transcriptional regulator, TrmB [Parcubacteria group bacterium GW2011_GWB1_37_13]KKQ33316.1 MAG: Transcriptional regulator, TrmB [Candidatus Nomurabacteria bacterium GW2011_GWA1_37_20]KKQ47334.1 MAG: Transcriptional regulator, TrmB [Candidatus Yanofskybacteria bacterium GW2011_GWC2_37_9]